MGITETEFKTVKLITYLFSYSIAMKLKFTLYQISFVSIYCNFMVGCIVLEYIIFDS